MKLIERKYYLDKLIRGIDTLDIKVITGVRRSVKSKLLTNSKILCIISINWRKSNREDVFTI